MEGPRACRKEEREKVLALINNTFRIPNGYRPTMGEEFQLMLGENNLENMRIILQNGEPVANVNFYKSTILIEGVPVKAASIGAVCTEVNSRAKGYSSQLLDDCERLMKEDNIRLMLVSGTRDLYKRRGCAIAGDCYEFNIKPSENNHENLQLIEFEESMLDEMVKLYSKESTRYYRTFEEFKYLLRGATTSWANFTYKTYLVSCSSEYCAYIVLRIINDKEGKRGAVVEAAGDRNIVSKALEEIIKVNELKNISYFCTFNDASSNVLKRENRSFKKWHVLGTIKILDFEGLMKDLKPYFLQHTEKEIVDRIVFNECDNKYIFELGDEFLELNDIYELTRLIFGSHQSLERNFSDKPLINKFLKSVFPIPFVWTANINYQ